MPLTQEPLTLQLARPFTIARGTQTEAGNVLVRLQDDGLEGLGEGAPSEHYGDTYDSTAAFLKSAAGQISAGAPISSVHESLDGIARLNPAAKAAVDMACYDLLGKRLGAPVYELLGLDPARAPRTSFTIGIDSPDVMAQKAGAAAGFPILKVKVGTDRDIENLEAIRSVSNAVIRVDANEAWHPKQAVAAITELDRFDIELVEQPVPAADLAGLGYVRDRSPVPIIADEAAVIPADVPRVAPFVDGINIKLMKCGGIYPALQMIHTARAHNLLVMMGCMIESSLAITAAAQLSPLLDFADLDGHLLIRDDPFEGVSVHEGRLVLPHGSGLGVEKRGG
ncbi:MAG TPA: dipeptide epimerase [Chloroflexota bacterium]|nr:dipeptide epimerase [Chloroflexota bacterium]